MNQQKENPWASLMCNIFIPVLILNQVEKRIEAITPTTALVLALCFPLGYGLNKFMKQKKVDFISVLGFVSILLTGGFALLHLDGEWFAVKEAGIPGIIGIIVLVSAYTPKPLIKMLLFQPAMFKVDLIDEKLRDKGREMKFERHLRLSTIYLSFSFFFSSILNYVLAKYFFQAIDQTLPDEEKTRILNTQIAEMTFWSYFVILIPSMICMFLIMLHLFRGIYKLTGLNFKDVIKEQG